MGTIVAKMRDLYHAVVRVFKGHRVHPELPYPMIDEVQVGNISAMLLLVSEGQTCPENIYAIDRDERIVWQVEERRDTTMRHYTKIYLSEGGALTAVRSDGVERILDPRNGRILKETRGTESSVKL